MEWFRLSEDYTIAELMYYYEYIGYLLDKDVIDMEFFRGISKEDPEEDTQEFIKVEVTD